MQKEQNFQDRFLLTLDSNHTSKLIKSMLKSPLGLSHEIVNCLFNDRFDEIRKNLDSIKKFVAGITRAEKLGEHYLLAKFYPPFFAFHQFFQASYLADKEKPSQKGFKNCL